MAQPSPVQLYLSLFWPLSRLNWPFSKYIIEPQVNCGQNVTQITLLFDGHFIIGMLVCIVVLKGCDHVVCYQTYMDFLLTLVVLAQLEIGIGSDSVAVKCKKILHFEM